MFVCGAVHAGVPERSHSILLQHSVNGGISWLLLNEFYSPTSTDTLFLHLPLPPSAQTNATRFRLWQPYNSGENIHYYYYLKNHTESYYLSLTILKCTFGKKYYLFHTVVFEQDLVLKILAM